MTSNLLFCYKLVLMQLFFLNCGKIKVNKKMKKFYILFLVLSVSFAQYSCSDDDITEPKPDPKVELDNKINNFIWKGMNSWYNWKSDVELLSNSKDDNQDDYYTFLNGYSTPDDLFYKLCYKYIGTVGKENAVDRFSWFIEDYTIQNQQFQGISKSFGFRLQAVQINSSGDIIFYVRYVAPNSPASDAGIKRGDIINAIDDIVLSDSNYDTAVKKFSNETIKLSFVSENNGNLVDEGSKSISAVVLSQNPVYFKKVFDNINGRKVGYLVYNGFRSSYNDELNDAFSFFKAEGINELILDLRLNGGGSVLSSAYLASMIYANANTGKFAELKFNKSHSNENGAYNFSNKLNIYNSEGEFVSEENINRLNTLSKLYVLTSSSTASASEMIINGLKAYFPVIVIGTTTYGKNVGSITLYDSPSSDFTNIKSANASHKNAMQPIVFQIFNKNNESDYIHGFKPDIEVVEYEFWNNILPFGDENEVVLKAALNDIRGISSKSISSVKKLGLKAFDVSSFENRFEKEMYIDSDFFNNN